jgi:outer membrane murein-binding lipoprotein Lpp
MHMSYRCHEQHRFKRMKQQLDKRVQLRFQLNAKKKKIADVASTLNAIPVDQIAEGPEAWFQEAEGENDANPDANAEPDEQSQSDEENVSSDFKPLSIGHGTGYILHPHAIKPTCCFGRLVRWYLRYRKTNFFSCISASFFS